MKISFTLLLVFYLFFNIILAPIASYGDDPTEPIDYEGRGGIEKGPCLGYESNRKCYGHTNNDGTCKDFPRGYMQTLYKLGESCGGGTVKIGFIFYNADPRKYEIIYCIPKLTVQMSKNSMIFEPALVRANIRIDTTDRKKKRVRFYDNENSIYRYGRLGNKLKKLQVLNIYDDGKQLELKTLGPDNRTLAGGKDGTSCHIGITNFGMNENIQISGGGSGNKILGDKIRSNDEFKKIPYFIDEDKKLLPDDGRMSAGGNPN